MEIPLDNVTKQIHENDMRIIKDQAREIHELQAVIVRLKAYWREICHSEQLDREHLERQVDYEAQRVGH